jgi:hypothetical protein
MVAGKMGKDRTTISSWSTQKFPGDIQFRGNEVVLTISKGREHAGCGSVLMPEIATGLSFDKTASATWTSLRQISAARAYFYAAADPAKKQRAYVVAGDVVGVIEEKGAWLKVEYPLQAEARRQRWIRTSDTAVLEPK